MGFGVLSFEMIDKWGSFVLASPEEEELQHLGGIELEAGHPYILG